MYLVLEYIKGGRRLYSSVRQHAKAGGQPVSTGVEQQTVPSGDSGVNCSVSVIKPSQSFVRTRRESAQCCHDIDEDDVFDSLEYVDANEATLYCVGRSGIEKARNMYLFFLANELSRILVN